MGGGVGAVGAEGVWARIGGLQELPIQQQRAEGGVGGEGGVRRGGDGGVGGEGGVRGVGV